MTRGANFIASIDPVALERERMRVHGNLEHERPGSRWTTRCVTRTPG